MPKRPIADKILLDTAFNVAKNPKYCGYQRSLASMVHKVLDKDSSNMSKGTGIKSHLISEN